MMYNNTDIEIELSDVSIDNILESKLIVYNDDINSFEWVIECFCKYLQHSSEQAEQCAMIIHNKGKASVKNGIKEDLLPYKTALDDAGLTTSIE